MSADVRSLSTIPMRNYEEWEVFDAKLRQVVQLGLLQPITPLKCLYARSEEWYRDLDDDEIYVYVRVDDKVIPRWERIDPFAEPKRAPSRNVRVGGFKLIETGPVTKEIAWLLERMLGDFAREGHIEILNPADQNHETWCREFSSGDIYRFTADREKQDFRWERLSEDEWKKATSQPN